MIPCEIHPSMAANKMCSKCGSPMCTICQFDHDGAIICASCIRREAMIKLSGVYEVQQRVGSELKKMLLLFLVGLGIGLLLTMVSRAGILVVVYLPFILPNLLIIWAAIKFTWKGMNNDGGMGRDLRGAAYNDGDGISFISKFMMFIFIIVLVLMFAPILFIYRIIRRWLDLKTLKKMSNGVNANLQKTNRDSDSKDDNEVFRTAITDLTIFIDSDTDSKLNKIIGRRI